MANPIITNFDTRGVVRAVEASEQGKLTSVGALTVEIGTILGRITVSGLYAPYDSGAADGSEIPVAVSLSKVEAAGAGDHVLSVLLKGKTQTDKTIIQGSAPGAGITAGIKDDLRTVMIVIEDTTDCSELDNQ